MPSDYQLKRDTPSNRSCLRAFIQGPASNRRHITTADDYDAPQNGYGRLEKYAANDSFETTRTGISDDTYGGPPRGRKGRNRVSNAMCRMKLAPNPRESLQGQQMDDMSFSQRSQVGLLCSDDNDNGLSSSFADIETWKTVKTCASSTASSNGRSSGTNYQQQENFRMKDNGNGAFPSEGSDDSFITAVEEIQHRKLSHTFMGCMSQIKQRRDFTPETSFVTAEEEIPNRKLSSTFKACVPQIKKKRDFINNPMPHIPEGSQPPKFNTSIVDEDSDFPQIIFANEAEDGMTDFENDVRNGRSRGVPNIQPFSAYQMTTEPGRQEYDECDECEPTSPERNSNLNRQNPSPIKSAREYRHEEQFLDNLASTLTPNYQDLQQHIYELTGKNELQRLMAQNQETTIPDIVDFSDQSDLVSEFGMASTSGGKYNDNANTMSFEPANDDYGPRSMQSNRVANYSNQHRGWQAQQAPSTKDSRAMNSQVEQRQMQWLQGGGNIEAAQKQRRLYDAEDADHTQHNGPYYGESARENFRRDELPAKSLVDDSCDDEVEENDPIYAFGGSGVSTAKIKPTTRFELDASEEVDHYRKPRRGHRMPIPSTKINRRAPSPPPMRPKEDSIDAMPSPTKVGLNARPLMPSTKINRRAHSPPPTRQDSIDAMPSPTKVGLSARPTNDEVSFEKWRECRRAVILQSNMERQKAASEQESSSDASSSISRFSRSSKYREVLGAAYKIQKERNFSVESNQTQKWSNTSRPRDSHISMPAHEEESHSAYSDTSRQKAYPNGRSVSEYRQ